MSDSIKQQNTEKQENNVTSANSMTSGSSPRTVVMRPSPPIIPRRSSSAKKTVTYRNEASSDNKSDHSPNSKDDSGSRDRSEKSNDKLKDKSQDKPKEEVNNKSGDHSENHISFHSESDRSDPSPGSGKSQSTGSDDLTDDHSDDHSDNHSDGHSDNKSDNHSDHSEETEHTDAYGADHDHNNVHNPTTPNSELAFPPTPSEDAGMKNPAYGSISDVSSHDVEKMIEKNNKYTPYMRRCMVYIDRAGKVIDEQKELSAALDKFEAMRDNCELCTEEDLRSFISDTQAMRAENELKLNVEKLVSLAQSNRDRYGECNNFCKSLEHDDIDCCLRDIDKYIKLFMRADEILKGHDDNSMSM